MLVGDFLFSRAFELMVEDGSLKVLKILSRASAVIAEGEVDQLTAQRRIETERGPLSRRSSAPRPRPCSPPPAASPRSSPSAARRPRTALDAYGRNLGIAFQLVDDAIDYASDAATMGKGVGDDFRDGKMTLARDPRLCARLARSDRAFWRDGDRGRAASRRATSPTPSRLLARSERARRHVERARHYGQRAIDALGPFPAGKAKAALIEAVEFAIARAY